MINPSQRLGLFVLVMHISVDFVLQLFLCYTIFLDVLSSLLLASLLIGILVVVDICKCVLLTLFPFTAVYSLSPFSPNLQLMVVFFYCKYIWFLLQSDILVLAIRLTSDPFKLISLNVRGISNFQKQRMIFTWCHKKNPDIIFLQETHSKKETELQ